MRQHRTLWQPGGAGRPEATFAMERAIDLLAIEMDIEPAELRRRNLIGPEQMPYRTGMLDRRGLPQEYDSGDYPELLSRAVDMIDLSAVRKRQSSLADSGRLVGVGFSMYIEMTGSGPFEGARAEVTQSGRVRLYTGASSQGQGHRTTFAQILADSFGVDIADVDVVAGDTSTIPDGIGTVASRALVTAGNATRQAGHLLRQRVLDAAANVMESNPADLEITNGIISVVGSPAKSITLAELIRAVPRATAGTGSDGLSETSYFQPPNYATASGAHAVVVEIEPRTGRVSIVDYVVVHEAGRIVNPCIADAQIVGGVAQGIGGILSEHMVYDPGGRPLTSTFADYAMPLASMIPDIRLDEIVCPSPTNPLGVKGLGEGGAVGPAAAITNAVEDALRRMASVDVTIRTGPLSPSRVLDLFAASPTLN